MTCKDCIHYKACDDSYNFVVVAQIRMVLEHFGVLTAHLQEEI